MISIKFNIGDLVSHRKHGIGRIYKIDPNSKDWTYLVDFTNKNGDKSKAWVSCDDVEIASLSSAN